MPRPVEIASQLDLPLASAATKAAEATGSATVTPLSLATDQLPLFPPAVASVPSSPRAGRAFLTFRKLGELLRRQTNRTPTPDPDQPQSAISNPKSAIQ